MIENRLLEYFLAVAREKNITRAAESLHIAQPSLTRQMQILEERLGKQLLIRGKRNVTLTEDGEFLRGRAKEILDLMEKTEDAFKSDIDNIAGDIAIGCGETPIMSFIADIWREIHEQYPDIHFHIFSGNAENVYEKLDQGLIDIGLMLGPSQSDRFNYLNLNRADHFGILVRNDHRLAVKESVSVDDLSGENFIMSSQVSHEFEHDSIFFELKEKVNVIGNYNLIYNAAFMVRSGMGIALTLNGLINTANDSIRFIPFDPAITIDSYLVTKKYQTPSPAVKFFMEKVQERI
ncbi:MAG: LysR family transcriptional regulator [Lachnospiraceae bacterium]|nr:LysR family transcriptional regulator [Lachnospiraceae bacterium]MEE3461452.1 LysR family transcriptional regulator [Lachnospiraceae bacterium]